MINNILVFMYVTCTMLLSTSAIADSGNESIDDGMIIGIYNQVNSFDIESALLAIKNSQSPKVKKLAGRVARDHRGVRLAAAELAEQIGAEVTLPAERQDAAKDYYQTVAELAQHSGKDFDRAYLLHEIDFHTKAMAAIKTLLLPAASNIKLIDHFHAVLPHFEHHLRETVKVAKSLGYYQDH